MATETMVQRGAAVQARTATRQKHLTTAFGVDQSVVSRWKYRKHSPFVKELVTVQRLAEAERLNPWPLLTEAIAVVAETQYRDWSITDLTERAAELYEAKHEADMRENLAGALRLGGGCRTAHKRALLEESMIQIELVAIEYVLSERGADWASHAARLCAAEGRSS